MPRGGHNLKPEGEAVNRVGARRAIKPRVVNIGKATGQPELPPRAGGWPKPTLEWWNIWGRSPLAHDFTEEDWAELRDTARYHAMIWDPNVTQTAMLKAGPIVRARMANFGATPLDRQRLRIQLVFADEAEEKAEEAKERRASSKARRGPLKDTWVTKGGRDA